MRLFGYCHWVWRVRTRTCHGGSYFSCGTGGAGIRGICIGRGASGMGTRAEAFVMALYLQAGKGESMKHHNRLN